LPHRKNTIYNISLSKIDKDIIILFATNVIIGILHFISMKIMTIFESKKLHYRKWFWYFYGIIFMLSGGVNLVEKGDLYWSFSIQFLLGLIVIILNFFGKIETKNSESY
tara:strand:- start:133 stop:459 length:327 start_codon:yes stop_codon:yes gene_type:complete